MSSMSEEEENYVRMSLLLTGLSPRAVRALFDKEFPPTSLPSTLKQKYNTLLILHKDRVINQVQWNLLFPPRLGLADSKSFDVALMICLIRNLTPLTPPAIGFDRLPSAGETTPGADLARIKYYRNYLAHLDESKIDNSYFTTAWNNISYAVQRLGGSSLYRECEYLKTKILDKSNQNLMLEVQNLKMLHGCLQDDMKELNKLCKVNTQQTRKLTISHAQTIEKIKHLKSGPQESIQEIVMLKDTVPWNIREQMTTKIESWKKEDRMFVETRAANHILSFLKTNSCVIVIASSGVGKTFSVRHVALQMADDGYDILPITNPEDIVKYHNPNKKTLYVIDDLCGTYTLNQTYFDIWKTMQEDIRSLIKNDTKIIASCRLQVYQDDHFKLLSLFSACECNLLPLSFAEKLLLAKTYLKSFASKIIEYINLYDFFPLLCRLYSENQQLDLVEFFKNPFSVYEEEIEKLNTEGAYGKYCALALCVMFNNHLQEKWLTDDVNQDIKQVIENTCEACRLNRTTSRLVLRDEFNSLINTFFKKEHGFFRTIHDKLFDFLCFYFGKTPMIQCIIKNGDGRLISERLRFKRDVYDQSASIVPDKYKKLYIERLFDDWFKGKVFVVFDNINMKSPEFMTTFVMYLKNLDVTYQKQLAAKFDNKAYTRNISLHTLLIHCCALGDINMVEWCCKYGADVNFGSDKKSPLYTACEGGHTDIVTKLMENKADINKCTKWGESPLYIASMRGYTDIVTQLIKNNADINKCTWSGESSLFIACNGNYADIVTKLVANKADINKCTSLGKSPLYIACEGGYTDIVCKLVDNKADMSMCTKWGESPLYIACKGGYTNIVSKLVENKAEINKCTRTGESPLFIACKGGYTDIVTRLVEGKADVNKCTGWEESPLYIASKGGHTDIVTKLLDNKADISMFTKCGESPLYIACKGGYQNIVTKLVENKADINKCTSLGKSPLYIACEGGYTDIVCKLVDNKADMSMCTKWGESPLYIACKGGYTNIVSKLVENKAEINKCTRTGESPLFIACKGGYTDIVTRLVEGKADVNKCTGWEESPLYIASKGGHTDIVTKLLENKADISMFTKCGESPLYIACKGGYQNIVTKLVENKADINKCTWYGESPLYIACKGGYANIVTTLVDNKADINMCTRVGVSPLFIACKGGYTDIVAKLLDNKADTSICTKCGESPLYIACKSGHQNIVTKLVDNKADINMCTKGGVSPLYVARKGGFT